MAVYHAAAVAQLEVSHRLQDAPHVLPVPGATLGRDARPGKRTALGMARAGSDALVRVVAGTVEMYLVDDVVERQRREIAEGDRSVGEVGLDDDGG